MAKKYTSIDGIKPGDLASFVRQTYRHFHADKLGYPAFRYECMKCGATVYATKERDGDGVKGPRQLSDYEWRRLRYELGGHYFHHHRSEVTTLPRVVKKLFKSSEFH